MNYARSITCHYSILHQLGVRDGELVTGRLHLDKVVLKRDVHSAEEAAMDLSHKLVKSALLKSSTLSNNKLLCFDSILGRRLVGRGGVHLD